MDKSVKHGIITVLIAGVLWGFSGVCGQYIMQRHSVSPDWLVPYRLVISGAILVLINIIKHGRQTFNIWKTDTPKLLTFAIFGMTLCQYSYFSSVNSSNAGTATVLQQVSIVMIMLYTCLKARKLPSIKENLCLILALAGVFFMATHGNIKSLVISPQGLFWGFCNALAVTLYTLIPAGLIKKYGSSITTGWGMLIGGTLIMVTFQPWNMNIGITPFILEMVAVIIVFGTILPFSMYLKGVVLAGANRAAMLSNMEPLTAALLAVIWLGEHFTPMDILGAVCILSTIFILGSDNK